MVTSNHCVYKAGYKYQLHEDFSIQIDILPVSDIFTEYIKLSKEGFLTIKEGYAWDGPSGPTIDTKTFMRGSLAHDALYQLMREGFLSQKCRAKADRLLKRMCKQDGMFGLRASWVHVGVKYFAKGAAKKKSKRKVLIAP